MTLSELAALAASIERAWQAGRFCGLVGRGIHARIKAIAERLAAGRIDRDRAMRLAREAEAAAYYFAPMPSGDLP